MIKETYKRKINSIIANFIFQDLRRIIFRDFFSDYKRFNEIPPKEIANNIQILLAGDDLDEPSAVYLDVFSKLTDEPEHTIRRLTAYYNDPNDHTFDGMFPNEWSDPDAVVSIDGEKVLTPDYLRNIVQNVFDYSLGGSDTANGNIKNLLSQVKPSAVPSNALSITESDFINLFFETWFTLIQVKPIDATDKDGNGAILDGRTKKFIYAETGEPVSESTELFCFDSNEPVSDSYVKYLTRSKYWFLDWLNDDELHNIDDTPDNITPKQGDPVPTGVSGSKKTAENILEEIFGKPTEPAEKPINKEGTKKKKQIQQHEKQQQEPQQRPDDEPTEPESETPTNEKELKDSFISAVPVGRPFAWWFLKTPKETEKQLETVNKYVQFRENAVIFNAGSWFDNETQYTRPVLAYLDFWSSKAQNVSPNKTLIEEKNGKWIELKGNNVQRYNPTGVSVENLDGRYLIRLNLKNFASELFPKETQGDNLSKYVSIIFKELNKLKNVSAIYNNENGDPVIVSSLLFYEINIATGDADIYLSSLFTAGVFKDGSNKLNYLSLPPDIFSSLGKRQARTFDLKLVYWLQAKATGITRRGLAPITEHQSKITEILTPNSKSAVWCHNDRAKKRIKEIAERLTKGGYLKTYSEPKRGSDVWSFTLSKDWRVSLDDLKS